MRLRGIDYGPCLDASGVRGWFGEGYPYHHLLRPFGLNFEGSTFVAKTTTMHARPGNMPLQEDGITPAEFRPRCIVVKPFKGVVLNSVGLSGPGFKNLLDRYMWQIIKKPFFLSFMSVAGTPHERAAELTEFVRNLKRRLHELHDGVGLQINFSCPNTGLDPAELLDEVDMALDIAAELNIPIMPKFNILVPPIIACRIADHPACDAICVSNTIPFGKMADQINWRKLFGEKSPLAHIGGGGLSGKPLLPLTAAWVRKARSIGIKKPMNAGGGILCPHDVDTLAMAGASSIFLGSIAILRGWRVAKTIRRAHEIMP